MPPTLKKTTLLLTTFLPQLHALHFIENLLCPQFNSTLFAQLPSGLKNQAPPNLHTNQYPITHHDNTFSPSPAPKDSQCTSIKSFSALGDSYSAGLGAQQRLRECASSPPPCTPKGCQQNTGAYGYQFAAKYSVQNFQNLPCSGADSTSVLNNQVAPATFLSPDGSIPDVVSMTVGGDDFSFFFDLVVSCVFNLPLNDTTCADWIKESYAKLPNIGSNLDNLFKAVNQRIAGAVNTKVVVLGYPSAFGNDSDDPDGFCPPFPEDASNRKAINDLVTKLNAVVKTAAQGAGRNFLYADVDAAWATHRWCDSGSSWFDSALCTQEKDTAGVDYYNIAFAHPTLDGQGAYLQALERALGC